MYIAPDSKFYFLENCPLDPTYDHTIYWISRSQQQQYFESIARYRLERQSYQRLNSGVMRVEIPADNLYRCNYVMFQNTAFGDKWFYAFITAVEYVNNAVSDVTYAIDVMQTYHFDYTPEMCFIEREHAATDRPGDNTVPENLELGPYIEHLWGSRVITEYSIVVAASFDKDFNNVGGALYSGLFSGCMLHVFDDPSECEQFLIEVSNHNKQDSVVSVFLMAKDFVQQPGRPVRTGRVEVPRPSTLIPAAYTPRNKKLLTWPYMYLYATNMNGKYAEYRYELFEGETCDFTTAGDMSCNPVVVMIPMNYKSTPANYVEMITMEGFPQLTYNIDTFRGWVAQSAGSIAVNALAGATAAAVAPAVAPIVAHNVFAQVASTVAQVYPRSTQPPQTRGGGGTTGYAAMGILDFVLSHRSITREYAVIIDGYFNMFGYATHRVKKPNRNVRPHWTYTKTVGCTVTGNVPGDDMRKICEIYNSGITFWLKPEEVGHYELNNDI